MDLTLFIVLIILATIIYYLISSIQSLVKEIKEIKEKCIHTNNSSKEDFDTVTEDPGKIISNKAIQILSNIQKLF